MTQKALTKTELFKPSWKRLDDPTENEHLPGTQAMRVFHPMAGVYVDNPYSAEPEILIGGLEQGIATVKTYQPSVDQYSRNFIETAFLRNGTTNNLPNLNPGMGAAAGLLFIAGGTRSPDGSSGAGFGADKKVMFMDAVTKSVERLPDMKHGRALPLVTASPDGRYVLVAGGYGVESVNANVASPTHKMIEIFDRQKGEWIDVACTFPGLEDLPVPRFAGSAVWVQEKGVDRIFFIGGSQQYQGLENSEPTKRVDVYDAGAKCWHEAELTTPRLLPGVALRVLDDGKPQVVIAGGGTGLLPARADPQIYSSELIDPIELTRGMGQHLPAQPALSMSLPTTTHGRSIDWSSTALVFKNARPSPCKGVDAVSMAYHFGFSRAYGAALESDQGNAK
jgi:hypothetical protein